MVDFKDFADKLQQEVVSDMAESYFGDRKALDNQIQAYYHMIDRLRVQVARLNQSAARLRVMLLDQETIDLFSNTLGFPHSFLIPTEEVASPLFSSLPFGLTDRGRYRRCLYTAYSNYQKIGSEYLNGVYRDDPDQPGRKLLSVNYLQLSALSERINQEVEYQNREMSPSRALRYVKQMDIDSAERGRLMGDPFLQEGCSLDCELEFKPVDFEGAGFPEFQDLPELFKVKAMIRRFCKEIYPSRKQDMKKSMQSLLDGYEQSDD